jgi:hypothetical protein
MATPSEKLRAARAAALVERLGRGKDLWRDFTFPGTDVRVRVAVLTTTEVQEAFAAGHQRFKELGIEVSVLSAEEFTGEQVTQLLARACSNPDEPIDGGRGRCAPFFADAGECRDVLTSDERAALFDLYLEVRADVRPDPEELDSETMTLIEEAQKKRDPSLLRGIGSARLRSFIASMGARSSS